MLELAAIILFITAGLAFLNRRYVGLPSAIGVMAIALALSLACIGLDWLGYPLVRNYEQNLLSSIDFSELLMQGMLSVLLFAGALHIDLSELRAFRWQVSLLAVVGTTISTLVVGFALFYLLSFTHVSLSLIHCLIFGALISPTDPIAVMGILRTAGAPKNTELVIAGESVFNDGVGVVLFSVLLATLVNDEPITLTSTLEIFAHEAGCGILLGLIAGYLAFVMLRSIDSYPEEILITLATVLGGYTLANHLGVSGPLAMVVAGLIIGNHGRALAMSDTTRKRIDAFGEALDEILNAVRTNRPGNHPHRSRSPLAVGWRPGSGPDPACTPGHGRTSGETAGQEIPPGARLLADPDLGRPARRHLGRTGIVAADRCGTGCHPDADLRGGDLLDPGPGPDHWQGCPHGVQSRQSSPAGSALIECQHLSQRQIRWRLADTRRPGLRRPGAAVRTRG